MRDPKAIRKAIMAARSVAAFVDPKFARVPLPDLGMPAPEVVVPEHSPAMHEAFGVPMPRQYAAGGDVEPYRDPETSHISEWNWRPLEDVQSDLGYMREIPSHVLKFGDFMDEIARKASDQGLTPRDLIKAYTITRSSIQRRAAKTDKVRQAGLPLHDFHDEMIRPEGAFGEWLHSPAGQAYLDAAEKGQVHHAAIEDAVRVMAPFGKHEKDIPDALSWAAVHLPGNESRVSELIHAGRLKASHPTEWRDFTSGIRGIGPSKSGFYASLLGRGDQPTLDARQIILHTGRPTKEATRFLSRKGGAGGVEAVNRLTARQEAMGLELPDRLSPYYQHLAHHAVWDQAGGDETTHEDVMRSMRHAASGGAIMPHEHWIGEIFHRLDGSGADRYAAGGEVEDENPYAQPNNLGLYSHAAVTAAGLPQERGTPEQFRGMLLNKGVKPSELHWGEYDYAFGNEPEVTRDEIAKHLDSMIPPIEEKTFRYRKDNEPSVRELSDKHYLERQQFWDERDQGMDPATVNARRREMSVRHAAERRNAWQGFPHHEGLTLPGGENYREILLKHGNGDMFKGVPVHFGGEPDVLASLMVKDRQDEEGDKVLHLDELQSDWAQKGRKEGFESNAQQDYKDYVSGLTRRFFEKAPEYFEQQGYSDDQVGPLLRKYQSDAASMAHVMGETDKFLALSEAADSSPSGNIKTAPYVTKTEDWVDLGLKRALREAAQQGHDKLAWSPGSTIADRYNLAKHVKDIFHERNEDGTHNIVVTDKNGNKIFDEEDIQPEKLVDHFGKGIAERIVGGEGLSGEEAQQRFDAAKQAHSDFIERLIDNDVARRRGLWHERNPGAEYPQDQEQMVRDIVRESITQNPSTHAKQQGILEEYEPIKRAYRDAYGDNVVMGQYTSPYRDWRKLSGVDLQMGEKWPFEMYDRMLPKRALRLAKMHDPEAELIKSRIHHNRDNYGQGTETSTDLHAIRITPKMRESILKRGFPAYAQGGEVEGYADGGEIDTPRFKQYMQHLKRIHSPLSEDPASVQKALKFAASYKSPIGMETGTGSLYKIKQSIPASAVTRTISSIPGVKLKPQKQGSWEDFYDLAKDNEFVNVGGDLSGFGRLTQINGKDLAWPVDLHAGADYMREPNPGRVWANIQAHATGFRSKIEDANRRGKELYGILSPMGPTAVNSSHNMFDTLMAQIPNANIDPDHLKEFDEAIKRGDHLADIRRSKPKLFAEYLKKLEKWPGLENAKEVSDFARPEKGNINGGHRTKIVEFMDQSRWRDRGFPEVGVTRAAITNPDLLGTGGNKMGYRVIKLSADEPAGGKSLFKHSTYPVDTFGEYVMDVPLVQRHYAQPDVIESMIMKPTAKGQIVHPYSEDVRGRQTARKLFEEQKQVQPVTQRFLDSVMMGMENQPKYGFKKGGAVRRALMIAKGSKKK